ncbi:hypothetical protein POM88_006588 [Heracleum sosnowskyi]|uniref:RING-type E3 ubiquitin transferase n=1 Tax=Heracleum sosnowskyi TaxID=360622 RepID=A0AAD8J2Y1_9APIA|nr:hypothetical protein POM88_006588 [Heracleum sosnowskyi]
MFQVLSLLGLLPFDCQRFSVRQFLKRNRREVAGRACARGCRSVYSSITRYSIQSVAFIVEEMAEQHFLKYNDAGSWIQDSAMILSMCKEVPWYLDDELVEYLGTLDYLQGLKMLGVKRTERVLPVGTPLTVVGEEVVNPSSVYVRMPPVRQILIHFLFMSALGAVSVQFVIHIDALVSTIGPYNPIVGMALMAHRSA